MENNPVLQWQKGAGWLILSGGVDVLSDIRALALSRIALEGSIAYIGVDDDSADEVIEDMGELGASTGFLVNVLTEDDATINAQISEAALIVIPAEIDPRDLQSVLKGAALSAIQAAYERGAVILAEGQAAALFGQLYVVEGMGYEGFDWLRGAFIAPEVTSVAESPVARDVLTSGAANIAVGIGSGSALALGPSGAVETWGEAQVTVALGGV